MLTDCVRGRTWVSKVLCSVTLVRHVDRLHSRVSSDLGFTSVRMDG
jgi:hypothetical protein